MILKHGSTVFFSRSVTLINDLLDSSNHGEENREPCSIIARRSTIYEMLLKLYNGCLIIILIGKLKGVNPSKYEEHVININYDFLPKIYFSRLWV